MHGDSSGCYTKLQLEQNTLYIQPQPLAARRGLNVFYEAHMESTTALIPLWTKPPKIKMGSLYEQRSPLSAGRGILYQNGILSHGACIFVSG